MNLMTRASRTLNPIHFEDLEPHRFEDLIRQLIYDYRDWTSLEATGRGARTTASTSGPSSASARTPRRRTRSARKATSLHRRSPPTGCGSSSANANAGSPPGNSNATSRTAFRVP